MGIQFVSAPTGELDQDRAAPQTSRRFDIRLRELRPHHADASLRKPSINSNVPSNPIGIHPMTSKSRIAWLALTGILALSCLLLAPGRFFSSSESGGSGLSRIFGGASESPGQPPPGNRDRGTTKPAKVTKLSIRELDQFLDARGINDGSVLFALLHSGDAKYRGLAMQLPDSPLKFMMLSMDVHDDPEMRLEWARKLHELDPLNTVSVLRHVSQLMDCGDRKKAAEVLNDVRKCDHTSNGYDRLIQEFEFARDFFGEERFGHLAAQSARIWPVRTAHYTVENYLDSLVYSNFSGGKETTVIHDLARDYLMDIGYSDEHAEMDALIQTRMLLSGIRSGSTDQELQDRLSKEIAGIQSRTDELFHAGLEEYEKSGRHRTASEDMDHVLDRFSRWKARNRIKE